MAEIRARTYYHDRNKNWVTFYERLVGEVNRVFAGSDLEFTTLHFDDEALGATTDEFLQILEVAVHYISEHPCGTS